MSSSAPQKFQFALRIERGRTRHPDRPILTDRFLIGAGSNCDLQLGGDIPILHSVIVPSEDGLWIDAVAAEPKLIVNHNDVRECQLEIGDLIEIGSFVFSVVQQVAAPPELDHEDESEELQLSSLSAEELIDLLAGELAEMERLEGRRVQGAAALLAAARQEQAINTGLLERRAAELDAREQSLQQRTEHLERAQARLEEFLRQLASSSATSAPGDDGDHPVRKTA